MEGQEQETSQEQVQVTPPPTAAFTAAKPKGKGSKWLIVFIILLLIGGAGIFFFTKTGSKEIPTPTPFFDTAPITDLETPSPTSSPEAVDKDSIVIEIKNGTGIVGEAAYLKTKLENLGYSDISAGNASSTDNTVTTVTFSKTIAQSVQDEIKSLLDKTYEEVTVKTSSTQESDVVVITGQRTGQATASPEAPSSPSSL